MGSTVTDRIAGVSTSVAIKAPVKAITQSNISLSGLGVQAGGSWTETLTAGDRVLVKDQTDAKENGVYTAFASGWRRASDFNGYRDMVKGTSVPLESTGDRYRVISDNPIIIGSTEINFQLHPQDARVIPVASRAAMKAYDVPPGTQISLEEGGRSGSGVIKSGTPPSDPQEGIYVVLNNGNYWERSDKSVLTPEMFGAKGDNTQNDWPMALAAFGFAKTGGKRLVFDGSKTYYLGAFPATGQEVKFDIDVDSFSLEPNGCTFRVDVSLDASHAANSDQVIVQVNNASGTWVGDYNCVGDAVQRSPTRIGYIALNVLNSSANTEGLTVGKINAEKALATVQATTTDPSLYRHKGATIDRAYNSAGYYGINCANNIDDLEYKVRTEDCIRSYFVYGVDNHDGIISSKDHASFSDVVVSRLSRDTSNIRALYFSENDLSSDEAVALNFVTDDTDAEVKNIDITMDVTKSNAANPTVAFRAFDGSSTPLSTTTNQWKNVQLKGVTNSTNDQRLLFVSGMAGSAKSTATVDKFLFGKTQDTKGFIVDAGDGGQTATADSATDLELDFKIRDLAYGVPILARVDLTAYDNASGSTAEYFSRELKVLFTMSSDGSTAIVNTQTLNTMTAGSLIPSIAVPAQLAGSYSLKVKVNNYTGANRFIKGVMTAYAFQEG